MSAKRFCIVKQLENKCLNNRFPESDMSSHTKPTQNRVKSPHFWSSHPINTKIWNALGRPHKIFRTRMLIPILKHVIAG